MLSTDTPDVLLAVAESGDISGQDLCAIVKKSARLQHIPVFLLMHSARPADYFRATSSERSCAWRFPAPWGNCSMRCGSLPRRLH